MMTLRMMNDLGLTMGLTLRASFFSRKTSLQESDFDATCLASGHAWHTGKSPIMDANHLQPSPLI